jgi:hypothetical protein
MQASLNLVSISFIVSILAAILPIIAFGIEYYRKRIRPQRGQWRRRTFAYNTVHRSVIPVPSSRDSDTLPHREANSHNLEDADDILLRLLREDPEEP